ncbi:MAG: hypothetical protein AAF226_00010 [Verrucomicrobiota bacterium]
MAIHSLGQSQTAGKRFTFDKAEKLSTVIPIGWKTSERPPSDTMYGGFEYKDQSASVFFTKAVLSDQASAMSDVIEGIIQTYENTENFNVSNYGKITTGEVAGPDKKWPAVFTSFDVDMSLIARDPEAPPRDVTFRFYIMVFETSSQAYVIQGSAMKPVVQGREKDIFSIMKNTIAQP